MDNVEQLTDSIYPDVRHPYYIVAPRYIRTSAGIRVLHLLCHALNRRGQAAYLLIYPSWFGEQVSPDLLTPILTRQVAERHFRRGFVPIMVYPETIAGNPFGAPCVVRYVLNFPGLLGGDKEYAPSELIFSYSKTLAETTRSPGNILFLPAIDTRIFRPPPEGLKRQGSCFYASKYRLAHGGSLFGITKNSIEITRYLPNSQQEIAELFQRSEVFYTYENTALAIEAVLCGCPAVFLPNPYLNEVIAIHELGAEGYAWGTNEAEVKRAKDTVAQGADNYLRTYKIFRTDLDQFIDLTQKHAEGRPYNAPLNVPSPTVFGTVGTLLRERGLANSVRRAARKARKVLSGYSVLPRCDTRQ